uniref:Uncharacterized protein n=1 Tax=Oryza punctata TaxID=4537 RepID=A0A0E0L4Q0_ORYPU
MEELQEADVLWPEMSPPSRGAHLPVLQLQGAASILPSRESFAGGEPGGSTPRTPTTSTATLFGRRRSDASTAAWLDDDDDVQAEEFQEADVLWPDDADGEDTAARDHQLGDVGEFWWLSGDSGEAAAAAGERLLSSPIDIPTGDRDLTTVLVHTHRRRRR